MAPPDRPKAKPPNLPPTKELGGRQGEPPPLRRQPPPVPGKASERPQDEPAPAAHRILVPMDDVPPAPPSMPTPPSRKDSPPGGIKIQGQGWHITMPHVALVAVLTTIGGWFGSKAVSKGESAELADVMREVRAGNKVLRDLTGDVADVREELRKARSNDTKILNYAEDTFTPMVASLRKLGVKVSYDGKADPARDVEFHQAPLGGSAPPIQPKSTLPERPNL